MVIDMNKAERNLYNYLKGVVEMNKIFYSYLTGRGRTGSDSTGPLYHAIEARDGHLPTFGKALCGAQPGLRSNGWSDYTSDHATCPKCLKKLAKLQEPTDSGGDNE